MKASDFEATYNRWVDGKLDATAAAEFEAALAAQGIDPDRERMAFESTRSLVRSRVSPPMANSDFFLHQLRHRMETEQSGAGRTRRFWTWPGLVWGGASATAIAAVLFALMIPLQSTRSSYFATVVDSRTYEEGLSADTVYNPRDNITIVWIDGMDYMTEDIVPR